MKKTMALACLFVIAMGVVFAGGVSDSSSGQPQTKNMRVGLSQKAPGADVGDIAEVEDRDVSAELRRNPKTDRAQGNVWAEPATSIKEGVERLPPPVYAISGVKGQEIRNTERVDIVVRLPESEKFIKGLIEGENVSEWIENLPRGLEALAHRVRVNDKTIKIYITGTPTVTSRAVVKVNIPELYLAGGRARQFVSPTEEENARAWETRQTGADTGTSN